jgi:hypothetical protein
MAYARKNKQADRQRIVFSHPQTLPQQRQSFEWRSSDRVKDETTN